MSLRLFSAFASSFSSLPSTSASYRLLTSRHMAVGMRGVMQTAASCATSNVYNLQTSPFLCGRPFSVSSRQAPFPLLRRESDAIGFYGRNMSFWKEFKEKISAEVEKNEDLKKAMEEVKKITKVPESVENSDALKKTKEIFQKTKQSTEADPSQAADASSSSTSNTFQATAATVKGIVDKTLQSSSSFLSQITQKMRGPLSGVKDRTASAYTAAKQSRENALKWFAETKEGSSSSSSSNMKKETSSQNQGSEGPAVREQNTTSDQQASSEQDTGKEQKEGTGERASKAESGEAAEEESKGGKGAGEGAADTVRQMTLQMATLYHQMKIQAAAAKEAVTQTVSKTKEISKQTIEATVEPVKDWVGKTSKDITSTIQETEVAKQTMEIKKKVERYVNDPKPENVYRPPGPIQPDDEMKALTEKQEALWKKQVRDLQNKLEETKVYKAISDAKNAIQDSDNPIVQKGLEVADTIVITADNISNKVLGGTTEAQVRATLRNYIPGFDIEEFLPTLSQKGGLIYRFIEAQSAEDLETLAKFCTETNCLRHALIAERMKSTLPPGHTRKVHILWVDDPELYQTNFNDSNENAQIIIFFNIQSYDEIINAEGVTVEGSPADCKAVKYIWVLQYDPSRGWLVQEDAIGAREAIW